MSLRIGARCTLLCWIGLNLAALLLVLCAAAADLSSSPVSSVAAPTSFLSSLSSSTLHSLSIVRSHPHSVAHFTQGFTADNSAGLPNSRRMIDLYESTGVWGGTALHRYAMHVGEQPIAAGSAGGGAVAGAFSAAAASTSLRLQSSLTLPLSIFGEGVCVFRGRLLQLTYQNGVFLSYPKSVLPAASSDDGTPQRSRVSPSQVHKLAYPQSSASLLSSAPAARTFSEGWGITFNSHSQRVVVSDGSSSLYLLHPDALSTVERTLDVHWIDSRGRQVPLDALNELEYVASSESGVHGDRGEIFANLYESYCIARIDPETGRVKGVMHADPRAFYSEPIKAAKRRRHPAVEAMNGIAFHEATQTMIVTGKLWPRMFEVTAVPHSMAAAAAAASAAASAPSPDSIPLGFDLPSVCPRSDMGSADLAYWQQVLAENAQRGMEEEAKERGVMQDAPAKQRPAAAAATINKQRWTPMPPHAQQMKARQEEAAATAASPAAASEALLSVHSASLAALSPSSLPRFSAESEYDEGAAPEPLSASTLLTLAEGAQSTAELGLDSSSAQFDPQLYVAQEMRRMRAEEMQEHRRQRARAHEGADAGAEEGVEPQQVDFQFMQLGEREILSGDFM